MNSINLIFSDYKKFIENTLNCEIEKMYSYVDSPDVVDVVSEEYLKPVCNNQGVIIIYFKDVNDRVAQFALDEITCVIYFNEKETIDCKASFMVFFN